MELPFFQGMSYNELGALLLMTDDDGKFMYTTNSPAAANNIQVYSAYDVDGLMLPEDGLMIPSVMAETAENRNIVLRFITVSCNFPAISMTCCLLAKAGNDNAKSVQRILLFCSQASYKGWIHCRDNELACVNLIAPNYGNTLQQNEHTLQTWQMREVLLGMCKKLILAHIAIHILHVLLFIVLN